MRMIAKAEPEPEGRQLGQLIAESNANAWTFKLDAAAVTHSNHLMIVSAVGHREQIQALRAMLNGAVKSIFRVRAPGSGYWGKSAAWAQGYEIQIERLGLSAFHLLAVAKCDGLLATLSDESLYQELKSERYTTPLIRSFTPWLRGELERNGQLQSLKCFQCNAALLRVSEKTLDELVEAGVGFGHLEIC